MNGGPAGAAPAVTSTMNALSSAEIKARLATAPAWTRARNAIRRTFEFRDFVAAMRFVNAVARAAEKAGHHPDMDIRWNKVTLILTTHDADGLTAKDFELARRCDALAARSA